MPAISSSDALVLVLNCGSSSIKFALYEVDQWPIPREPWWSGRVEEITSAAPRYSAQGESPQVLSLDEHKPYASALAYIRAQAELRAGGRERIIGVAHRVVHGGSKYFAPVRMNAQVLTDLKSYIPLAPLHQPFALDAIEALFSLEPDWPQIACFDTAFHRSQGELESRFALPWSAWERGVRRYGFHGLSYEYMSHVLPERHGDLARGRVIVAHLGSGASLCAMRGLESVGTSMGFSALDGLMMGTRCGNLDPGAVIYLMQIEKLTLDEVARMLYYDSGLLGVSGVSSDPRELLPVEQDNERVRIALDLYVHRIVREIGALTALLGGLDLLVFTAGIGEHNDVLRKRICERLGFVGGRLDAKANAAHASVISAVDSDVVLAVEPTNEEWVAAWHAARLLGQTPSVQKSVRAP